MEVVVSGPREAEPVKSKGKNNLTESLRILADLIGGEQAARAGALDQRIDSLTGYINAVDSRVTTAANTAVAAREAAEAAMQRASREPPAPVKQSETVAWCALGSVAVLAVAFIAKCFGAF